VSRWRREPAESLVSIERRRLIESYKPDLPGPLRRGPSDEPEPAREVIDVGEWRNDHHAAAAPASSGQSGAETRPRRRRGRPPGRKQRRQVHFHVDPDEDRLLLAAARQFGSQQKGLIAALHALQEVLELREQMARLQVQYERQHTLLTEAEALFNR